VRNQDSRLAELNKQLTRGMVCFGSQRGTHIRSIGQVMRRLTSRPSSPLAVMDENSLQANSMSTTCQQLELNSQFSIIRPSITRALHRALNTFERLEPYNGLHVTIHSAHCFPGSSNTLSDVTISSNIIEHQCHDNSSLFSAVPAAAWEAIDVQPSFVTDSLSICQCQRGVNDASYNYLSHRLFPVGPSNDSGCYQLTLLKASLSNIP
jgi:hypothetical protein